jgi:hypothetical protein
MEISAISSSAAYDPTVAAQSQSGASAQSVKGAGRGPRGAPPAGGGGAPPAGGAAKAESSSKTSSSSSTTKIYDKRDTDKDGKVSNEEQIQYELQHSSEEKTSASKVTGYNQQGKTTSASGDQQSSLDLLA